MGIKRPAPHPYTIGTVVEIHDLVGGAWLLVEADQVSGLDGHGLELRSIPLNPALTAG